MWVADLAMNVPRHLHCLNKRLSTPFPQSRVAAAEGFTGFYNGFIEDTFCERRRRDFLSYTLFPQLDTDKFLGCPWLELLGERFDFSKGSLLTPWKFSSNKLPQFCRHLYIIFSCVDINVLRSNFQLIMLPRGQLIMCHHLSRWWLALYSRQAIIVTNVGQVHWAIASQLNHTEKYFFIITPMGSNEFVDISTHYMEI